MDDWGGVGKHGLMQKEKIMRLISWHQVSCKYLYLMKLLSIDFSYFISISLIRHSSHLCMLMAEKFYNYDLFNNYNSFFSSILTHTTFQRS